MINEIFSLTFPIDWDEIGSIASAVAVIIALYTNHKMTKEMKTTLEIQNQSKGLELMEERLRIAECIQTDSVVPERKLKIIFNSEIFAAYENYKKCAQQYQGAKADEKTFFDCLKQETEEGGYSNRIKEKIEQYEIWMNTPDCPDRIFDEYKKYCKDTAIYYSETGRPEDYKWYNHSEISEKISNAYESLSEAKESLLHQIEQFIKASIKDVEQ